MEDSDEEEKESDHQEKRSSKNEKNADRLPNAKDTYEKQEKIPEVIEAK